VARRRAGQTKGGELIAIAMAAALLVFVGREALHTQGARPTPPPAAVPPTHDTGTSTSVTQAGQPARRDSIPIRRGTAGRAGAAKPDRAEIRRRIELGAHGTYIADMLLDSDSMLTRWPERTIEPVRVWVQRGSSIPDWTSDYTRVAHDAFAEWGEVGFPVRFTFTVDSSSADVRITFADRFTDKNRLGVTTHRHDENGWIASADIVIAIHDSAGVALAPGLISAIARHEVGHALGLAHSRDRATIMYPESHTLVISGPDRATIKLLYTLPPGSVK
jgi:hypothetical protein